MKIGEIHRSVVYHLTLETVASSLSGTLLRNVFEIQRVDGLREVLS